jgi:hypothetical protein
LIQVLVTYLYNKTFAQRKHLKTTPLDNPISLKLIDRLISTSGTIYETTTIQVDFLTGESQTLQFFLTNLDSSCQVVLGLNWLKQYNPVINWRSGHISFEPTRTIPRNLNPVQESNSTLLETKHASESTLTIGSNTSSTSEKNNPVINNSTITGVNQKTFLRAAQVKDSQTYMVLVRKKPSEVQMAQGATSNVSNFYATNISNVPKEYSDFTDVFDKKEAEALPQHQSYDHAIPLEEGTSPPMGPIYSLSKSELQIL